MTTTGPDFISLQVADLERSAAFYEQHLGLQRQPGPPHAVVFGTAPAAFAVREAMPGVDLASMPVPSGGVGIWIRVPDARATHQQLAAAGVPIVAEPVAGPFGWTLTFVDPDGYRITLHDQA